MAEYQKLTHGFGPYYDEESRILILGSFPSVKSREQQFFYGHPMNRFWPVISKIFHKETPQTIEEKKIFLRSCHIALYDVIEECEIKGSSDASIKNPIVSDLPKIISHSKIHKIFLNGKKAGTLFERYQLPLLGEGTDYAVLPSTSPANAATSMDKLVEIWGKEILGN